MASRSIICRSRRLRQIIDLRDTDKSRYFAITEFNNCLISRSPSLFSYFNHFLTAQGSDLPFFSRERGSNYANMATMAPKRGFSVATPLLRAGCVCFQVLWPVYSTRLDYDLFRPTSSVFFFFFIRDE